MRRGKRGRRRATPARTRSAQRRAPILHIGPLRRADRAALRGLVLGFLNYHRDIAGDPRVRASDAREAMRGWRRRRHHVFFALRWRGQLVGFMVLRKEPGASIFWGEELYVHPNFRRRGIAREAMRFAERYVLARGGDALYLWVAASNTRTLRVFQRLGFGLVNMVELRKDLSRGKSARARGRNARTKPLVLGGVPFRLQRTGATRA